MIPFLAAQAQEDTASAKGIIQSLINGMIWIPYLLVSKRVKNTFIN